MRDYLHKRHSAVIVGVNVSVPSHQGVLRDIQDKRAEASHSPVQLLVLHLESFHCSEIIVSTLVGNLLQKWCHASVSPSKADVIIQIYYHSTTYKTPQKAINKTQIPQILTWIVSTTHPVNKIPWVGGVDGGELLLHHSQDENTPHTIFLPKILLSRSLAANISPLSLTKTLQAQCWNWLGPFVSGMSLETKEEMKLEIMSGSQKSSGDNERDNESCRFPPQQKHIPSTPFLSVEF